MGRTIVTENDVRKAREARDHLYGLDVYLARRPARSRLRDLLEDLRDRPGESGTAPTPDEEEKPKEGPRGAEPEKEDPERQRSQREEEEERRRREAAEREERRREEVRRREAEEVTRAAPWQGVDNYTDRLLKYIPAESVALYLTLQGIVLSGVEGPAQKFWLWIIFGIGVFGTSLYLWRIQQVSKRMQLAVSTAAFGVWVFALGGAFASLSWYEPFIGSLALVVFTFFVPLISPDVLGREEAA
jgi:hypothetical protein